jgi:hypothetical protein
VQPETKRRHGTRPAVLLFKILSVHLTCLLQRRIFFSNPYHLLYYNSRPFILREHLSAILNTTTTTSTMPFNTNQLKRVPLRKNPNFQRHGRKSYAYALQKCMSRRPPFSVGH